MTTPFSSPTLAARIQTSLNAPVDPAVRAFANDLGEEAGGLAVLFYGSNLRTVSLDGVLDFYVLLPGPVETGPMAPIYRAAALAIPPNGS